MALCITDDGLALPDKDDRHILAAAIKCTAQIIVIFNRLHQRVESASPNELRMDNFSE